MALYGTPVPRTSTLNLSASATLTYTQIRDYLAIQAATSSMTVTLPAPVAALVNMHFFLTNTSAGSVTLACTNGFVRDDDSITLESKQTLQVLCVRETATTFRWWITGTSPSYANLDEYVADTVGAMLSDNTETGASLSYQDTDNTIDLVVAYGTDANTACQGNDARLPADAATFTPTLTWTTADPTISEAVYRAQIVNGRAWVSGHIICSDGKGATGLVVDFPAGLIPANVDQRIPFAAQVKVGAGAFANVVAEVNASTATEGDRQLEITTGTLTDSSTAEVTFTGNFEV